MSRSIVLGGGCFWCLEALYQRVRGVSKVDPGYAGGQKPNPTYEEVCSGSTGHVEVVRLEFDPAEITLSQILEIFWQIHDPTTPNRQGHDVGTQYRSAIYYDGDEQKQEVEKSLKKVAIPAWGEKIITEIKPLEAFYPAEEYHRNYFKSHPEQAYCQIVINPKLDKLKEKFPSLLKED
jgi:peptide-methionine (S)-S-oxide reductase